MSLLTELENSFDWLLQRFRAAGAGDESSLNARPHPDLLPRGQGESFAASLESRATGAVEFGTAGASEARPRFGDEVDDFDGVTSCESAVAAALCRRSP
jgi:hypothetical protein